VVDGSAAVKAVEVVPAERAVVGEDEVEVEVTTTGSTSRASSAVPVAFPQPTADIPIRATSARRGMVRRQRIGPA
jgi:hypothetical protein